MRALRPLASLLLLATSTSASLPNPSFAASVPLFAHVRWANFSASDLAGLLRFRSVTVQVEPDAPLPCEAQAADVAARLAAAAASAAAQTPSAPAPAPPPVLMYGNLFYAEPNCAYFSEVANTSWLWLNTTLPNGTMVPYTPAGRFTFDLSVDPRAPAWWADHVIVAAGVQGGFADGGCGGNPPSWLNASHGAAYAAAQRTALALTTSVLNASTSLFVANCPVLPAIGDGYIAGVRGEMIESWCSDFQPKSGGEATYCRDELLEAVALSAWGNVSLQARYYLNKDNDYNPYFGLAAFMIAAWTEPGSYFGASRDWDWSGDWENLLAWPWANYTPGQPVDPPTMLDPQGCSWKRTYPNANVSVDLCAKHFFAQIVWGAGGEGEGEGDQTLAAAAAAQRPEPASLPAPSATGPWTGNSPHSRGLRPVRVLEAGLGSPCPPRHATVLAPWAVGGRACVGFDAEAMAAAAAAAAVGEGGS
jgi:hypothetical protein